MEKLLTDVLARYDAMSKELQTAFRLVPRHSFIHTTYSVGEQGPWTSRPINPERSDDMESIYVDAPLVVTLEGTLPDVINSKPSVVIRMIDALGLKAGMSVLEVGTGTGYTAGLLSKLVGDSGSVTTIEINRDQAGQAERRLRLLGFKNVAVVAGDGRLPVASKSEFDGIIVHSSSPFVARSWETQLKPGGCLVMIRKFQNTQLLLQMNKRRPDGMDGKALGFTHFPTIRNDGEWGFGGHERIGWASPPPQHLKTGLNQEEFSAFQALNDSQFLLSLDLNHGFLEVLPVALFPYIPALAKPRPVVLDRRTDDPLFGPLYSCSAAGAADIHGDKDVLSELVHAYKHWVEHAELTYANLRIKVAHSASDNSEGSNTAERSESSTWVDKPDDEMHLPWITQLSTSLAEEVSA